MNIPPPPSKLETSASHQQKISSKGMLSFQKNTMKRRRCTVSLSQPAGQQTIEESEEGSSEYRLGSVMDGLKNAPRRRTVRNDASSPAVIIRKTLMNI